jgi:hypothetical protein
MKKTLLICGALLALAAPAFAQGHINMAWTDCVGSGAEAGNVNNACTSNTGLAGTLITSFQPPFELPHFIGCAGTIDLQTNAAVLSPWFHADATGCRTGKVSWSADFTGGPFNCIDVWQGQAGGGMDYAVPSPGVPYPTGNGPNTARIRTLQAIVEPGADISPFDATAQTPNEYYAFKINISKALSTGTGACAGCLDKACFVFNSMSLSQPAPVADVNLTSGPVQVATYNGGTGAALCPGATPNHKSTWGSVKALYR